MILTSQRDSNYFIWQLLVQERNFEKVGIDLKDVYHLIGYNNVSNPEWEKWKSKFKSNLVFIQDTRESKHYLLSLRFFLLSEFFKANPALVNKYVLHIDSDVIFREELLLETMMDGRVHLSDTDHYTGYTHFVQTRVPEILEDMCRIVGIDSNIIKTKKAGGAQWFFTGLDWNFFKTCEIQSEQMHLNYFAKINYYKSKFYGCEENAETIRQIENSATTKFNFQHWTFEMWVWLWNMWKLGIKTFNNSDLDFSWATDSIDRYNQCSIFHNAGIANGDVRFNKQNYINTFPFNKNFQIQNNAQDEYIRLINSFDESYEFPKVVKEVPIYQTAQDILVSSFLYITDNTKPINIYTYIEHTGHK